MAAFSKFKVVGLGSVGGMSDGVFEGHPVAAMSLFSGQDASISFSLLRSFFAIGEPGAKFPERSSTVGLFVGAASASALPASIQL